MPRDIRTTPGRKPSPGEISAILRERLQKRRGDLEQLAWTRVRSLADPGETADPEYLEGLRDAVRAALDYALAVIERGEGSPPALPAPLLLQARLAARNGVSLDTVLRRYFAGYSLLSDFLIAEAEGDVRLREGKLAPLLRPLASLFDRLLAAVTEEHRSEEARRLGSSERRAELVRRLLDGELVDAAELSYEFQGHHVGLACAGADAADAIRGLSRQLDRRVLIVSRENTVWAWLGGRRPTDMAALEEACQASWPTRCPLAVGEPGHGLADWRLTHRQALAALPVAQRRPGEAVRYSDVAPLASALRDDVLRTSLRRLYLEPLEGARGGGHVARETLRAYFDADRNVSSTAAALDVDRHTVSNRLRTIEKLLGRSLGECATALESALRLEAFGDRGP